MITLPPGFSLKPMLAAGLAIFVAIAIGIGLAFVDRAFDESEKAGAAGQQVREMEGVIEDVETAQTAVEDLRRDPDMRRSGCMRHSRTPENC